MGWLSSAWDSVCSFTSGVCSVAKDVFGIVAWRRQSPAARRWGSARGEAHRLMFWGEQGGNEGIPPGGDAGPWRGARSRRSDVYRRSTRRTWIPTSGS